MSAPPVTDPGPAAIREASGADFAAIAELQIESWRGAYRGILPDTYLDDAIVAERHAHWRRPEAAAGIVLVTGDGPGLAGFVSVELRADARFDATVANLHVRAHLRGAGLGRALLGAAVERLSALGARSLCLWVYERNRAALRFYGRLGGQADAFGFDDFAGAHAAHRRIAWRDLERLRLACRQPG